MYYSSKHHKNKLNRYITNRINKHRKDMNNTYKVNLATLLNISRSKKDFFLFNVENNKVVNYKISNDLKSYYNNTFTKFRLIDDLKKEIDKLTFN